MDYYYFDPYYRNWFNYLYLYPSIPYYYQYPNIGYEPYITGERYPEAPGQIVPHMATSESTLDIINKCPDKWVRIWLKEAPPQQPVEFWMQVERVDRVNATGKRVYRTADGRLVSDYTVIELEKISQITCGKPSAPGPITGPITGPTPDGQCGPNQPGRHIQTGNYAKEYIQVTYEVYECRITVTTYAFGFQVGKEILSREKNSFDWKKSHGGANYHVKGWVENKSLYISGEYKIGGYVTWSSGRVKLGSWNQLKF